MPLVFEASSMKGAFFWDLFWIICSVNFFILVHWCRRRGCGGCKRTPKVLIWWKLGQNLRKFVKNLWKSSQNCCTCFDFTKMAPKKIIFFWKFMHWFTYFRAIEGKFGEVLVKFGQKWCLTASIWKQCAQWNAVVFYGGHFLWILFRASLQKFGLKFFAPPKICLLLHLCFSCVNVLKGSVNVLSTSKMTLDFAAETTRCRGPISRLQQDRMATNIKWKL